MRRLGRDTSLFARATTIEGVLTKAQLMRRVFARCRFRHPCPREIAPDGSGSRGVCNEHSPVTCLASPMGRPSTRIVAATEACNTGGHSAASVAVQGAAALAAKPGSSVGCNRASGPPGGRRARRRLVDPCKREGGFRAAFFVWRTVIAVTVLREALCLSWKLNGAGQRGVWPPHVLRSGGAAPRERADSSNSQARSAGREND